MTVLVTGANGFVGSALCRELIRDGRRVRAAYRSDRPEDFTGDLVKVGEVNRHTDWERALKGVNQVVHLAAKVHTTDDGSNFLSSFREINVEGTVRLAMQACQYGVKRFVFISSVKVNGEETQIGNPFAPVDPYVLDSAYGAAKWEAESALRRIALNTGLQVVIIRSPLVYGKGVKANFHKMMRWLYLRRPLPLSAFTENRRSLVFLNNLIDLIILCVDHPVAANQTFMVSDDEDLSTVDLLVRTGTALRRPARLFYVPPLLIRLAAKGTRKEPVYQRLCGSLQVDISKTKKLLNWNPPFSVDDGLSDSVKNFDI